MGAAIRASMTFPLYFMPIEIDGKLLFDGGMVNNFPQDLMEKIFDPDIIIGHKVAGSLQAPSSDNVVEQITSMLMSQPRMKYLLKKEFCWKQIYQP